MIDKIIKDKVMGSLKSDIDNYLRKDKLKIQLLRNMVAKQRKSITDFSQYTEIENNIFNYFQEIFRNKKILIKVNLIISEYYHHLLSKEDIKILTKEKVITCIVKYINQETNQSKTENQTVFEQRLIKALIFMF